MRQRFPAGKVSPGEAFKLFGFGQHHRADFIGGFVAEWWEVLDEWLPHYLPQASALAELNQRARAVAGNPIDGFDRAPCDRGGAGRAGGGIDLCATDLRAIEREVSRADEITNRIEIALRIGTQIFVEQHEDARFSEGRLPSLEMRRVAAEVGAAIDLEAPVAVEGVVDGTALRAQELVERIQACGGVAEGDDDFAVGNVVLDSFARNRVGEISGTHLAAGHIGGIVAEQIAVPLRAAVVANVEKSLFLFARQADVAQQDLVQPRGTGSRRADMNKAGQSQRVSVIHVVAAIASQSLTIAQCRSEVKESRILINR